MITNKPYENIAVIIGKLMNLRKVHERLGATFYEITVRVNRTTPGKYDNIIVYAPQWALPDGIAINDTIRLIGEVRIYKNRNSLWQAKCMKVYTKRIDVVGSTVPHTNRVELIGDICQVWGKRKIPLTERVITELALMVYRTEGYSKGERADRIHCIAWGDSLEKVHHEPDTKVHVIGRIQERTFEKENPNGTVAKETTHEVSCQVIENC